MTRQPIAAAVVEITGYGNPYTLVTNVRGDTDSVTIDDGLPFDLAADADGYEPYVRLHLPAPKAPLTVLVELTR